MSLQQETNSIHKSALLKARLLFLFVFIVDLLGLYAICSLIVILFPPERLDPQSAGYLWILWGFFGAGVLFFAAYALLTKYLSGKERIRWLLIIVLLNVVGLPLFYRFICRRLHIDELREKQKILRAEEFLEKIEVPRDSLSEAEFAEVVEQYEKIRRIKINRMVSGALSLLGVGNCVYLLLLMHPLPANAGKFLSEMNKEMLQQMILSLIWVGAVAGFSLTMFIHSTIVLLLSPTTRQLTKLLQAGIKDG